MQANLPDLLDTEDLLEKPENYLNTGDDFVRGNDEPTLEGNVTTTDMMTALLWIKNNAGASVYLDYEANPKTRERNAVSIVNAEGKSLLWHALPKCTHEILIAALCNTEVVYFQSDLEKGFPFSRDLGLQLAAITCVGTAMASLSDYAALYNLRRKATGIDYAAFSKPSLSPTEIDYAIRDCQLLRELEQKIHEPIVSPLEYEMKILVGNKQELRCTKAVVARHLPKLFDLAKDGIVDLRCPHGRAAVLPANVFRDIVRNGEDGARYYPVDCGSTENGNRCVPVSIAVELGRDRGMCLPSRPSWHVICALLQSTSPRFFSKFRTSIEKGFFMNEIDTISEEFAVRVLTRHAFNAQCL